MSSARTATGYWVDAPGRGTLRTHELAAAGADEVELVTRFSGVSCGTERLVGRGRVPASASATMACAGMQGSFALPVLYGYSLVGEVVAGAERGRRAFTMHPHQDRVVVPRDRLVLLPDAVPSAPPRRPRGFDFTRSNIAKNANGAPSTVPTSTVCPSPPR